MQAAENLATYPGIAAIVDVYVAQTTPAHLNHFYRSILEANEFPGPAVVIVYSACMPEHGIADDAASHQARLAVNSTSISAVHL